MDTFTPQMNLAMTLAALNAQVIRRVDSSLSLHGISFTEFMVMQHLKESVNQCMRRIDLAEQIGLTASGVTRLLSPMEKIGLVQKEKNPRDARVSLVKITETGVQMLADASVSFERSAEKLFATIETPQLEQFAQISKRLLK